MLHCLCGRINEALKYTDSPYRLSPKGELSFVPAPSFEVRHPVCFFCGAQRQGKDWGLWVPKPRMCVCGAVEKWKAMPGSFVEKRGDGAYTIPAFRSRGAMWFCPACGGRLNDGVDPFDRTNRYQFPDD
jgi:hypothetical protein